MGRDLRDEALQPRGGEPEVDVAAVGHGLGGAVGDLDGLGQAGGDLLRGLSQLPRELEARRARVVTVLGILGPAQF